MSLDLTFKFQSVAELNATIDALDWAYDNSTDILANAQPEDCDEHLRPEQEIVKLLALRNVLARLSGAQVIQRPRMPKHLRAQYPQYDHD